MATCDDHLNIPHDIGDTDHVPVHLLSQLSCRGDSCTQWTMAFSSLTLSHWQLSSNSVSNLSAPCIPLPAAILQKDAGQVLLKSGIQRLCLCHLVGLVIWAVPFTLGVLWISWHISRTLLVILCTDVICITQGEGLRFFLVPVHT